MTPFEDISIFQGLVQYYDDLGNEWRRSISGYGMFYFLERKADSDTFIYQGHIQGHENSIKALHNEFIQARGY